MPKNGKILVGMGEIEAYTGRPGITIKKWVTNFNFPAVKIDGRWESNTDLIDSYQKKRIEALTGKHAEQESIEED